MAGQRQKRGNAFMRLIRYRLHIPMLRSPHPPEYTARGVMMGMIWGFIPLFGIQMGGVLLTWTVATRLLKWEFALIPALAFIWITNIFTIIPTYYVYYVTGQAMLGHWSDIAGYEAFAALFASTAPPDAGISSKRLGVDTDAADLLGRADRPWFDPVDDPDGLARLSDQLPVYLRLP